MYVCTYVKTSPLPPAPVSRQLTIGFEVELRLSSWAWQDIETALFRFEVLRSPDAFICEIGVVISISMSNKRWIVISTSRLNWQDNQDQNLDSACLPARNMVNRDYNSILTFQCVRNSSWGDFSVFSGVFLRTWGFLFGDLDDHSGRPVVHRDTSCDTLAVLI